MEKNVIGYIFKNNCPKLSSEIRSILLMDILKTNADMNFAEENVMWNFSSLLFIS